MIWKTAVAWAGMLPLIWMLGGSIRRLARHDKFAWRIGHWIVCELKPFVPIAFGIEAVYEVVPRHFEEPIWVEAAMFSLALWPVLRHMFDDDDDDDRWKHRKDKLAEKVAEIGGKLTVVPESA